MTSVSIYSCACGAKYKTVRSAAMNSESSISEFTCSACAKTIHTDGDIISLHVEVRPDVWQLLPPGKTPPNRYRLFKMCGGEELETREVIGAAAAFAELDQLKSELTPQERAKGVIWILQAAM